MGSKVNASLINMIMRKVLEIYSQRLVRTVLRGLLGQFPEACWDHSQRLARNPPRHMQKLGKLLELQKYSAKLF